MRKRDKKLDNTLREALTEVCELALKEVPGFTWLTHLANYNDFPGSLSIVCVFDTIHDVSSALAARQDEYLQAQIEHKLSAAGIHIRDLKSHLSFDSEEACQNENGGKWRERLR